MIPMLLSLMLSLAPRAPMKRLRPLAYAIASTGASIDEAAELTTISFFETTFGRAGIPFGVSCCRRDAWSLERAAARALHILRWARRVCGASLESRMDFYRRGICRGDTLAEQRARYVRRLWSRLACR